MPNLTITPALSWPRLTMGCWALIGDANWGAQKESDSLAAIDTALESGLRAFDTAPMYGKGESEALLGRALKSRRTEVLIASKVSGRLTAATIISSCEESLRRLQTDYIDLYQIHWPDPLTPLEETADALLKLRDEKKIRAIGVCNFGIRDLNAAVKVMPVFSNQMPYSLLWRGLEYEVLPLCLSQGIGIIAYSSLMQGLLTGKFQSAAEVPEGRARTKHFSSEFRAQVKHGQPGHEEETFASIARLRDICRREEVPMATASLAALLACNGILSVIAGARNADQSRENAEALATRLPEDLVMELLEATENLKRATGADVDPWAAPSRIR